MMFRNATRVIVVLAATAALGQSAQPGTTAGEPILNRQAPAARRGPVANKAAEAQGTAGLRERVGDMESTLSQMHLVLKQMHAKAAKSKATDSLTKANLDLWELMAGHLDKELQQLRLALAAREDLEARRAALYKQADANAAKEAQAFRAAQAARFEQAAQNANGTPTPAPTAQSAEQSHASQVTPAQPAPVPQTNNAPSPN